MQNHQVIYDANKKPLFVVIPYDDEYKRAFGIEPSLAAMSSDYEIPLTITLPNAGAGATIDLPRFVEYWVRCGIQSLPINKRAKPLREFEGRERFSLEALIRTCFITEPYRNTMQAVNEVTDQLINTGLFREVRFNQAQLLPGKIFDREQAILQAEIQPYSRTVNCLEIVYEKAAEFCKQHPIPKDSKIDSRWFNRDRP
ncbi:hypothetical protein PMI36_05580 [Pseudomonas sp. GM79]|uniref:hypothetical protein n=1 Tax=Pseudomonas sp. GM79 TaxID=1144338 RepID=UPI00026F7CBF|nr:hypothetical protein [Pseudomonas sp. GM79]EJN17246.1 hypothetical protein PMI36_05580 [Pseudomonas sp. GM79]